MIWLVGAKGMLGKDIALRLQLEGLDYITSDLEVDITCLETIKSFIINKHITWIVNSSAFTNVEGAETQKDKAFAVNELGVLHLATIAKTLNIPIIHFSTDYVFDGTKGDYLETDSVNPLSVYGASKYAGELAIQQTTHQHYIFRISWLFGKHGANFVYKMLELFQTKSELRVVSDQFGSPTYTQDVSSILLHVLSNPHIAYGTYHLTNQGKTSWYQFALDIYDKAKQYHHPHSTLNIIPVESSQYPTVAKRPMNSHLIKTKLENAFNISIPTWQSALDRFFQEITNTVE